MEQIVYRKKIDRYSYNSFDKIGKGSFSTVYKGIDQTTDQPVAIKVIEMDKLKSSFNKYLLASQMEVLWILKEKPGVLSFYNKLTTKNNTYIITQLCKTDLLSLIKENNCLPQKNACKYLAQIIQAYRSIYQNDIIHRDIKPANLLIDHQDKIKIADFGFAIEKSKLTYPCQYSVGSPMYMAVQCFKENQYSVKSDIWAIGVVFFEMLTGKGPWMGRNEKQLYAIIQKNPIQDILEDMKIPLSATTKQFLTRALQKDVFKRMSPNQMFGFSEKLQKHHLGNSIIKVSLKNQNEKVLKITRKLTKDSENNSLQQSGSSVKQESNTEEIKQKLKIFYQKKEVLKIILNQIHFCRFINIVLYKINITGKKPIFTDQQMNTLNKFKRMFVELLKKKIQWITNFDRGQNPLSMLHYEKFIKDTSFEKLKDIAKDYEVKYSNQFTEWNSCSAISINKTSKMNIQELILQFISILRVNINSLILDNEEEEVKKYNNEILLLDFLITAYHLIVMQKNLDRKEFLDRCKLIQILYSPSRSISHSLFIRIDEKAKKITAE